MQAILPVDLLTLQTTLTSPKKIAGLSEVLLLPRLKITKKWWNRSTREFSDVPPYMISTIHTLANLLLLQVMNLSKPFAALLMIHLLSRLKSVRYLHANRKRAFVPNVTDVTSQPVVWFRRAKP